jgi:tRNA(fMet)-specific endonuclease VapC
VKKLILDTNAYSRLRQGDRAVLALLGEADAVLMSIFVLGELHAGFNGGTQRDANRRSLQEFLSLPTVSLLFATDETAQIFGALKDDLRRGGTPLPINDVWIAAHALETGATLLSYDAHFGRVKGLRRWPES